MAKKFIIFTLLLALALLLALSQAEQLTRAWLVYKLEQVLDAEVRIDGEITLDPGANSRLSVSGISIEKPGQKIAADRLTILVNSRSLTEDRLSVPRIRVENVRVDVRGTSRSKDEPLDLDQILSRLAHSLDTLDQSSVDIKQIMVAGGRLTYVDPDQDVHLALRNLSLTTANQSTFELHILGRLNEDDLLLSARLRRDTAGLGITLKSQWAQFDIKLSGTIGSIVPLKGVDVGFSATGPSARPLLELIGAQEIRDGPVSINSHVRDQAKQYIWMAGAQIGSLDLQAELTHSLDGPDFHLDFTAAGPSLKEAGALVDYLDYSALPFDLSGTITRAGTAVTLSNGRIQLGDGSFRAEGTLPDYPALKNWALRIKATDFDLSVLQPFSPCALPRLPMDWLGNFSSTTEGLEMFELSFENSHQRIDVSGELGPYPDFNGTSINVASNGLDLGVLSTCAGITLDRGYPTDITFNVNRTNDVWRVDDLNLASEIVSAKSNLQITADNSATGKFELTSQDVHRSAAAAGFDASRLQASSAEVAFDLAIIDSAITLSSGLFNAGAAHRGRFFATVNPNENDEPNSLPQFDLSLEFVSPDLAAFLTAVPEIAQNQAVTLKSRFSSTGGGFTNAEVRLAIDQNRIKATASLPRGEEFSGSAVNIEGQGPSLARMLGPFLPYPLPDAPFDAALKLKHNGTELQIEDLLVESAGQQLSGKLKLDLTQNLSRTEGNLTLKGNSSAALFGLLGFKPKFLDRPYELIANVDAQDERVFIHLEQASLGESDVAGEIIITPGDIYQYNVTLASERIYLPFLIPSLITATDDKKDPVKAKDRILPGLDLPWTWLSGIDVTFEHRARIVDLQPGNHASTQLAFSVRDGRLQSQDLSWESDLSDGSASILVTQKPEDPTDANLNFEITSQRIPMLWLFTGQPVVTEGERLQFNASVTTHGRTTLEMLRHMNGKVAFRGGGGVINTGKLDTLFGDFLSQLTKRVFTSSQKQTQVSCTSGAFMIENGKLAFDPGLAVRTGRFDILTTGNIDLPSERMKLQLNSRSRQGIGVSAVSSLVPRVGIGGTMAKPQIQVSATETALSGGAAIASSGLSILAAGLWDRLRSSMENPCDALFERAINDPKLGYASLLSKDKR